MKKIISAWPSIIIILATVVLGVIFSLMQVKLSERMMKLGAEEAGMSYATVSGIQKIRLSGAEKRAFSAGRTCAPGTRSCSTIRL